MCESCATNKLLTSIISVYSLRLHKIGRISSKPPSIFMLMNTPQYGVCRHQLHTTLVCLPLLYCCIRRSYTATVFSKFFTRIIVRFRISASN